MKKTICLLSIYSVILYHPLSGFLTLFANILQNPRGPDAVADLELMKHVTEFISPLVTEDSPFFLLASTRLLSQLELVAAQLLAKTNVEPQMSMMPTPQTDISGYSTTPNIMDPPQPSLHINSDVQNFEVRILAVITLPVT